MFGEVSRLTVYTKENWTWARTRFNIIQQNRNINWPNMQAVLICTCYKNKQEIAHKRGRDLAKSLQEVHNNLRYLKDGKEEKLGKFKMNLVSFKNQ